MPLRLGVTLRLGTASVRASSSTTPREALLVAAVDSNI